MTFNRDEVSELLVRCHRRCCICHRFCGVKIETDHIVPSEENGTDDIGNAIPVCFECHAEIHSYNDKHPRGRKFTPAELRSHKEQWLKICSEYPETLVGAIRNADVGPLQALVDELEFNATVASVRNYSEHGCKFRDEQFFRAISEGSLSLLRDEIRKPLLEAYRAIGSANSAIDRRNSSPYEEGVSEAGSFVSRAESQVLLAKAALLLFLSSEPRRNPSA